MGRLLFGTKYENGLDKGVRQICLSNEMWITMDLDGDKSIVNTVIRNTAIKYNIKVDALENTVFNEKNAIKDEVFDEEEAIRHVCNNFNQMVKEYLNIYGYKMKDISEKQMKNILSIIQSDYRNDMRLLLYHMFKDFLEEKMYEYYLKENLLK